MYCRAHFHYLCRCTGSYALGDNDPNWIWKYFLLYPVRLSVNSSCVHFLTEQSILIQAGSKTDGSLASSDACTSDASLLWQTLTLAHAWWIITMIKVLTMCMMVLIVRRKMVIGGDWPWQTADGPLAQPLPPPSLSPHPLAALLASCHRETQCCWHECQALTLSASCADVNIPARQIVP